MYLQHFGLNQQPFSLTPDTEFFFRNPQHVEALEVLNVALESGEGFLKVTGEVGTGKTLLCRTLLNGLGPHWRSAYIPNPYLRPDALRRSIAEELELPIKERTTQHQLIKMLQDHLIATAEHGNRVLVCVDEAQALSDQSFEALRLLSNLETEKFKLLQVVLFGQPELDERLAQPSLRQLRQRISFSYQLSPLDCEGVGHYLSHRLAVAGYNGQPLFSASAIKEIHRCSRGIPRLVNQIAHKSLMLVFGRGDYVTEVSDIRFAASDTEGAFVAQKIPLWQWLGLVGLVLIGAVFIGLGFGVWP